MSAMNQCCRLVRNRNTKLPQIAPETARSQGGSQGQAVRPEPGIQGCCWRRFRVPLRGPGMTMLMFIANQEYLLI